MKKKERKKEKSRFLTVSGSVCGQPLMKVPQCVVVVFHSYVTTMTVRRLETVQRQRYFRFCKCITYIIESVDSISRDGPDCTYVIHYKIENISV